MTIADGTAIIVSIIAFLHTIHTKRKMDERDKLKDQRDLIKERDELMRIALTAQLTLGDIVCRLYQISDPAAKYSPKDRQLAEELLGPVPEAAKNIEIMRKMIEEREPTTSLIDGAALNIHKQQIYANTLMEEISRMVLVP